MRAGNLVRRERSARGVPTALSSIVMKAMALQPANRYTSARELALDVERWMADEPVSTFRNQAGTDDALDTPA